jgi:Zn-dependent M28 family amino/carboxypeptidase
VAGLNNEERAQIAAMLNFDMVGSPNVVRFVYDGDLRSGRTKPSVHRRGQGVSPTAGSNVQLPSLSGTGTTFSYSVTPAR